MAVFLQRQIQRLKRHLLTLGAGCEEQLRDALEAVEKRDPKLAQQVIDRDDRLDEDEVEIEEECLHTLALHQPVAFDIRFVVAVLKIANDLERIGDHASNIAKQCIALADLPEVGPVPYDLHGMGQTTQKMLTLALDAVVHLDVEQANEVRRLDDRVDEINRGMYSAVLVAMSDHPDKKQQYMHLASVSRQLERVADHACNIAKQVLSTVEGHNVRHRKLGEPSEPIPPVQH